jgi:hypothetical protein
MYASILQKFLSVGVDMLPPLEDLSATTIKVGRCRLNR